MYELINEEGRARFYKTNFTIKVGKGGELKEPTNLIMVSDAKTHIERLVFAVYLIEGYKIKDIADGTAGCLRVDWGELAGEMTLSIDGGDFTTIRVDEEYIKELYELNTEEKYEQKQFEQQQFARPTAEHLEIALLEQQLEHAQNTISYLDDYIDKQTKQLDLTNGLIRGERTGKVSDAMFKSEIMRIVGWKL